MSVFPAERQELPSTAGVMLEVCFSVLKTLEASLASYARRCLR